MPLMNKDTDMDPHQIAGSNFGFSAKRIDALGAAEYTLVGIAADKSGSVRPFKSAIEDCIKAVVAACQRSPRVDNLMLRLTQFGDRVEETHGFKPLSECDPKSYADCLRPGGCTALFDAATNMISSISQYGKSLTDSDFGVNAIVFVITDGADNQSSFTAASVKQALEQVISGETVESMVSILIGVNMQDAMISMYLNAFHRDAGFTQYVELKDASSSTLARLADFVSRSVSAQSQSLGTGGPSKALTF